MATRSSPRSSRSSSGCRSSTTTGPCRAAARARDDTSIKELYCLPNEAPIAEFEGKTESLVAAIRKRDNEPKFEKVRKVLEDLLPRIQKVTKEANPLSELARLLDQLLCDEINTGDESEPVLREFWSQPEMVQTRRQATLLRDEAKYGDPLYIVKEFGRGRVAVMTTDAGGTYANKKQWTDWPSLSGVCRLAADRGRNAEVSLRRR